MDQLMAEARTALMLTRHGVALGWQRIRRSESGEGVISAAIAVLIMAFLGAAMWVAFHTTMNHAQSKVDSNVNTIGQDTGGSSGGSTGVGGTGP